MTPPVFVLADLADSAPGVSIEISGPEGRHAVSAMRLAPGEPVAVVDGRGRRVAGVVEGAEGRDRLQVRVTDVIDEPQPSPRVIVVQALPKGDRGELAVELLTEIGVDAIVPWAARNCVAQWRGDRADRGLARWSEAARTAAKQSRRARFPDVVPVAQTRDVVDLIGKASLALVLHEEATQDVGSIRLPGEGDIVIVVGPEGGIAEEELSGFVSAGAQPVRLGPTVLRTSTAGIAAVAAVLSRSSRWSDRMPS